MKVPYGWLKDYVDLDLPPKDLTECLTMAGIEVEAVEELGDSFKGLVVGRIIALRPHKEGGHLSVCLVDTGEEKMPIVCGAPNIAVGDMVPLALPGTILPNGKAVEKAEIGGELSMGMLCSAEELTLKDDSYGILQLDKGLRPGMALASAIGLDEAVLQLNITPNRGDCLSVIGIAREVAAITGAELHYPTFELKEESEPADKWTSVDVLEPELCPRYTARIISEIKVKHSPLWMQVRLKLAGMRPVNNIVDITNYVMWEVGQPLHAFDYHLLEENRIVVRRAQKGELLVTLDGAARTLDDTMLVIADANRSVGLAGIMGAQNTEVSPKTRVVLLEAAHFNPLNNRRTSKKLGLNTEASYRFQRYVDPLGTALAADRAAYFMSILTGGRVARGLAEKWQVREAPRRITLRARRVNKILGTELQKGEIQAYLNKLRLQVHEEDENNLIVDVPSYRADLTREIDLVEEIARLYGYQNIKSTIPYGQTALKNPLIMESPERAVRESLTELGFTEIINFSFISEKSLDKLLIPQEDHRREVVRLKNPLSQDWTCMRTTMLPGLLQTILFNFNRDHYNLKLFEIGRTYFHTGEDQLPVEKSCVAAAITGLREKSVWASKREGVDFFDLKGPLERVLEKLQCGNVKFEKADIPYFNPLRAAYIIVENEKVGAIGEINEKVLKAFDLYRKVIACEIDLQKLSQFSGKRPLRFQPLPKFPSLLRDIALVLDEKLPSVEVSTAIEEIAPQILKRIRLFDAYTGGNLPPGQKNLAYSLVFQSEDRTLLGQEVDRFMERLVNHLRDKFGARLR